MNKILLNLILLVLNFHKSHGSASSINKENLTRCIDVLLENCEFRAHYELQKNCKYEKLIEILDIHNGKINNQSNILFTKKTSTALRKLRNFFRSCKGYEKKTEKSKKRIFGKYLKYNNLTLLSLATFPQLTKADILQRIANLFRFSGILLITVHFRKNIMRKKEVTFLDFSSFASYLLIKDINTIYVQLGGNKTRGKNLEKIAIDIHKIIDETLRHNIKDNAYENIPYKTASGILKITNLTLLIQHLAKNANMTLPKNTHIIIQKSFFENFNKFTEKFTNSNEDLIDLHDFFLLVTVKKLNLLLKDVKLENVLFKEYSQIDSDDIQKKCLKKLLSFDNRIMDPLIFIKMNNGMIDKINTTVQDMLKLKQSLKNMPFINTEADLMLPNLNSLRQFPEVIYKLGRSHIDNMVILSKWKRYEELYSIPNMKIDFILNHDSVLYPDCEEEKKDYDVRVYSLIMNAFNLVYLCEDNSQYIDLKKVNIKSSNVKHIIEHYCNNDTIIPFNIEPRKILEVLATTKAVADIYNCKPSSINLEKCKTPN
ncbi:unnamed protein product [Gordionus sp. m RMFG-2023]